MDSSAGAPEPSLRKLSADVTQRKYRRHHSTSRSDSSSAEDGPEHEMNTKRRRSHSPVEHKEGHSKATESSGRKDNSRYLENEQSHARSCRGHESIRHSDRRSYGTSRESRRYDDCRRYHNRFAADDEWSCPRTSISDRESRADTHSDRARCDNTSDRLQSNWRNVDGRYGEKSGNPEQSKNKEKERFLREHRRYDDGEYDKYADGRKQTYSNRDYGDYREHGEKIDRYRITGKCKDGHASSREECKRYPEDKQSKNKEIIEQEVPKKCSIKEIGKGCYAREPEAESRDKRRSLFSSVGSDVENKRYLESKPDTSEKKSSFGGGSGDGKPSSSSNQALGASVAVSKEAGALDNVDAAKVAAMKAAELVNRNIVGLGGVGAGRLSTDQKKRLLWGNKKSNASEETTKRWDLNLFSDRERQEKFNKLMGVKDSVIQESNVDSKDGNLEEAKKREELDMDLEKHYIAGLRRRDGRTVGLGL